MPWTLQIVGCVNGEPHEFDGKYVKLYDPTYHLPNGQYEGGILELTTDRGQARRFVSHVEAMEQWRQPAGCKCHGIRPWDGNPNRPLTAFHVAIERTD